MSSEFAKKTSQSVDPRWFDRHAPDMGSHWHAFGDTLNKRGPLDAKTRELIMVAAASLGRCPHCTRGHIHAAKQAGAEAAEITEAMMVSALIASGAEIHWILEDYEELLGDDTAEPWFAQQLPEIGQAWRELHDGVLADSRLERKTKELVAVAAGAIARCRHCTRTHIKEAQNHGATQQEISEALMVAALQASGTQLMWHTEGFEELLG